MGVPENMCFCSLLVWWGRSIGFFLYKFDLKSPCSNGRLYMRKESFYTFLVKENGFCLLIEGSSLMVDINITIETHRIIRAGFGLGVPFKILTTIKNLKIGPNCRFWLWCNVIFQNVLTTYQSVVGITKRLCQPFNFDLWDPVHFLTLHLLWQPSHFEALLQLESSQFSLFCTIHFHFHFLTFPPNKNLLSMPSSLDIYNSPLGLGCWCQLC